MTPDLMRAGANALRNAEKRAQAAEGSTSGGRVAS